MKLEITYKLPKPGFFIQIPNVGVISTEGERWTGLFDSEEEALIFEKQNDDVLERITLYYVETEEDED